MQLTIHQSETQQLKQIPQ